jgi:antitoxin component YwqK of YwqJK toxin-antitoxin module
LVLGLVGMVYQMYAGDFENDDDFFNQKIEDSEYFKDDESDKFSPENSFLKREDNEKEQIENPRNSKISDGIDKAFYPDGKLKYEISYRDGRRDGMEKLFYPDGKLKSEISYRNGRRDGMEKLFYPDGKLKSETSYQNGRKSGIEKLFAPDGRFISERFF